MRSARVAEAEALRDEIARAGGRAAVVQRGSRAIMRRSRTCRGGGGGARAALAAGQQRGELRAGRDRRARCRALRPPVRGQSARAAVPERGVRRAGADERGRLDRQHSRSARVQARRRTSSPTRWRRARCMPRRACWRRRWRRRCASMRWRPGRRWRARARPADDFARQAAAVPLGRGPEPGGDRRRGGLSRRRAQRDRRDARGRRRAASGLADAGRRASTE